LLPGVPGAICGIYPKPLDVLALRFAAVFPTFQGPALDPGLDHLFGLPLGLIGRGHDYAPGCPRLGRRAIGIALSIRQAGVDLVQDLI
jgi:hypothetical protein